MNSLPTDLVSTLNSNETFMLAARFPDGHGNEPVTFHSLSAVQLIRLYVDAGEYIENYGESDSTLDGLYFPIPAYDLLSDVPGYSPLGALIWLPTINQFGSCDSQHGVLYSFPDVTWSEILESPEKFVNCQWYPERVDHDLIRPWQDERFANIEPTSYPD